MNKIIFLILALFSFSAFSAPIADIPARSVVFLIKGNPKSIYSSFKKLKKESFEHENIHFLVKDVKASFRILALFAKRDFADYDVLVRIDLKSELTAAQEEALRTLKDQLKPNSKDLVIFLSNNTQFHKVEKDKEKDIAMAFINRWRPEQTKEEGQAYWINNHGPLVMKVGLPPAVKS